MKNLLWGLLSSLLVSACSGNDTRRSLTDYVSGFEPDERPLATTMVYECTAQDFVARLGPGEMAVWLDDRYVVLSQVRSDSGVVYEEGEISFWLRDGEAMLSVDQQLYQNCELAPERVPWEDARRRGVDFRAQGNEPGWDLEVQLNKQLLFVGDYGARRVLVSEFSVSEVGTMHLYEGNNAGNTLRVEVEDAPCADTMSDARFPNRVMVTLNDVTFEGCGQFLDYPWEDWE